MKLLKCNSSDGDRASNKNAAPVVAGMNVSKGPWRLYRWGVGTLILLAAVLSSRGALCEPVLTVLSQVNTSATSGTGQHDSTIDTAVANISVAGVEDDRDSCARPRGRNSSAASRGAISESRPSSAVTTVAMSVSAEARGGHYRTCTAGFLGISGNDTVAEASSVAQATVGVQFPPGTSIGDYVVTFLGTEGLAPDTFSWQLRGITSVQLAPAGGATRFLVAAGPGTYFRVDLLLKAHARNEGGCCSTAKNAENVVSIGVQRAGLLESMATRFSTRMVKGDIEKGYPQVGLLTLPNAVTRAAEPHCSGALLTARAVLTAAHCVYKRPEGMRFMLGSDIRDASSTWLDVAGWAYPKGEDGDFGLQYSDSNHVDDVAIVYLREPVTADVPFYGLHQGLPDLAQVLTDRSKLTFIGFGAFEAGRAGDGAGLKRRLMLDLTKVELRTFTNRGDGDANTCKGDSGAPAFVKATEGATLIAGVVSKGDDACLYNGINTRVQHYIQWIEAHK